MTRLFSYTLRIDDGAAPNPFHGICSLAICKPTIRRTAQVGDWIAGLGSRNASAGDLSGCLAYAMKVQKIITLAEYDQRVENEWPEKIPIVTSRDLAARLGDCIYSYASGSPHYQRAGVHSVGNKKADLGGLNVLLSEDFYYFGSCAVELPPHLTPIVHQTQGHKSTANAPYVAPFEHWIRGFGGGGQIFGWPDFVVDWSSDWVARGCEARAEESEHDPVC